MRRERKSSIFGVCNRDRNNTHLPWKRFEHNEYIAKTQNEYHEAEEAMEKIRQK